MGTQPPRGKDKMCILLVSLAKAGILMPGSIPGTKPSSKRTIAQEAIWMEVSLSFKSGRAKTCQLWFARLSVAISSQFSSYNSSFHLGLSSLTKKVKKNEGGKKTRKEIKEKLS